MSRVDRSDPCPRWVGRSRGDGVNRWTGGPGRWTDGPERRKGELLQPSAAVRRLQSMVNDVVLVVDDEPQIRRVVRNALASETTRVIEAANGRDAIDLAAAERPVAHRARPWPPGRPAASRSAARSAHGRRRRSSCCRRGTRTRKRSRCSTPAPTTTSPSRSVPSELQARVRAQLRRARLAPAAGEAQAITIGDLVIDPVKPSLKKTDVAGPSHEDRVGVAAHAAQARRPHADAPAALSRGVGKFVGRHAAVSARAHAQSAAEDRRRIPFGRD